MTKIEDYAFLSDTQTGALVSRDGCVDWLCFPRFDSPACFASLLGEKKNGHWRFWPNEKITKTQRRYRGDTLILETEIETAAGAVRLIDFMPPRGENPDIIRIVEGLRGKGYGRALLVDLAKIARARGCGRMEWAVLNWNDPAIQFYRKLGAKPMDEWTVFRLTRDGIAKLAES